MGGEISSILTGDGGEGGFKKEPYPTWLRRISETGRMLSLKKNAQGEAKYGAQTIRKKGLKHLKCVLVPGREEDGTKREANIFVTNREGR